MITAFLRNPNRPLITLICTALLLNGCILERIFRVKNQLCDFDKNFQIEIAEGFRVILSKPVMLDDDITWLAGAEPSHQQFVGDDLVMTYIAERKEAPSGGRYDLPIELRFARLDGKFRLKEGYLGKNLTDLLTNELLTQIMQSVCRSQKSLVKQQIVIDINTLDRSLMPTRSAISAILGPPNPGTGIERHWIWDYQLKNSDDADKETVIEIDFNNPGERILRINVKYLRYRLDADFEKGEAVLSVDIFHDKET